MLRARACCDFCDELKLDGASSPPIIGALLLPPLPAKLKLLLLPWLE